MMHHELVYTLETVDEVARELQEILSKVAVMTFSGSLGAGKTTLIQALLRRCDIDVDIQSPTFTYLNTYVNTQGYSFYHFDLYRIRSLKHFLEAGFDEYLYQPRSWTFIEWPEIVMSLVQKKACHCVIEYCGENRRRLRYAIT